MWERFRYRVWQGLGILRASFTPLDEAALAAHLSPGLLALFKTMPRGDQSHGLRVMAALRAAGHDDPDLMVAALLHDVGKARYPYGLLSRTIAILGRKLFPSWAASRAEGEPTGFGRPFVIYAQHPAWSAEMMAAAGASPLAVEIARRHQEIIPDPPRDRADELLAILRVADDLN